MPGKKKLQRFAEMDTFTNVIQPAMSDITQVKDSGVFGDHPLKGKWKSTFFQNEQPLVLELGCGKGEYSVGMGRKFPAKNFLGVDIKGARIWRGAKTALDEGLTNVGFLRTRIDLITSFFGEAEVDEIWITFPDPQPQQSRERKRLTAPLFINRYRKLLKPDGLVHLKTDSTDLYEYTMEQIHEQGYRLITHTPNLYAELIDSLDKDTQDILGIRTHYENLFSAQGYSIKYIKFQIH